jgi:hypothetical protein
VSDLGRSLLLSGVNGLSGNTVEEIYLGGRFLKHGAPMDKQYGVRSIGSFTAFGGLFRMICAPFVSYVLFRFFIGFSDVQVMPLMPIFAVFALTLSLYTIPIGYLLAKVASRSLKLGNQL